MNNYYLGIDPSLTGSGIFFLSDDGKNIFFEINTKPGEYDSSLHRVDYIANKIVEAINIYKPVCIMSEDYFSGRQPGTVIQLAELGTMIRLRILENGNTFFVSSPTKLKKFVTGVGNCGKELILKGIYKRWNIDIGSNNVADACGLAYMAKALYNKLNGVPQQLFKYEDECLKDYSKESEIKQYNCKTNNPKVKVKVKSK